MTEKETMAMTLMVSTIKAIKAELLENTRWNDLTLREKIILVHLANMDVEMTKYT